MDKSKYIILAIFLIIVIAIGASFYKYIQSSPNPEERIRIIVTIVPQAEFVEKIGGGKISVTIMVPPGASPHTYEPTPSQMEEVAQAKMYAKVGSGVEFELAWMERIIKTNPDMLIVDCSRGINLIEMTAADEREHEQEHDHDCVGKDPHIWLSPRNAMIMVENMHEGLVKIDPSNEDYYARNKDAYIQDLKNLDSELKDSFSGLTTKKFMVYHPAWGYLAHDYGLEQIPIEEEGKEPTPESIAHLIDQAKEHNIKILFATPEFETKTAETVANEIDGSVVLISPLAKDYIDNLKKISKEIAKSLQ